MASVKQAWIKKYGIEDGLRKWEDQKKKYGRTKAQLRDQYGDKYVDELSKKKSSYSLESCINRYGEIEGPKKWQDRLNKKIETQRKRKDAGHVYKNGRTLLEYQKRYGIEDGYKRWKKRNGRQSYMASKQRYIDEFGEHLGSEICKSIKDNSSLNYYIRKYGKKEGTDRYIERCSKCAITEEKMISKYGKEIGRLKYKEWLLKVTETKNGLFKRGYSLISQKLFWGVYNNLSVNLQEKCYFAELNTEYQFFVNHENNYLNKIIMPDFKCGKCIIEYDGEYWHDKELDKHRDALLESKGYVTLRIHGKEYQQNEKECITKCIKFINERT
jgi:hypothetical protein